MYISNSNIMIFSSGSGEVARVTPEGVMKFSIEANDENALRFVECIERVIKKRLTGIDIVKLSVTID
jgi:hypothetical protein